MDTGYGIERWAWLSQGKPSAFQVIYGSVLDKIFNLASVKFDEKLVAKVVPFSSYMNVERGESRIDARKKVADILQVWIGESWRKVSCPIENVMAVADHTKTIAFLLSEGVVPSNVEEGYLAASPDPTNLPHAPPARNRRQDARDLGFTNRLLGRDFPQLKDMRREIAEAIKSEEVKYRQDAGTWLRSGQEGFQRSESEGTEGDSIRDSRRAI